MPLGILGVVVGAVVVLRDVKPDPLLVPEPRLFFIFNKSNLSPARLLHFLALVLAFQGVYRLIAPWIPQLAAHLSAMGRNSLAVFSIGSLLSLAGQLVRFRFGGGIIMDTLIVVSGLAALVFTAWFVEWRSRSRRSLRSA